MPLLTAPVPYAAGAYSVVGYGGFRVWVVPVGPSISAMARLAPPAWAVTTVPTLQWRATPAPGGLSMPLGQPASSLQYIRFRVTASVNGNQAYNPTGDAVGFGFVAISSGGGNVPPGSFLAGSWETDTIAGQTAYIAKILVGPGGSFTPAAGTSWWVWIKITDSPEVPVIPAGRLDII